MFYLFSLLVGVGSLVYVIPLPYEKRYLFLRKNRKVIYIDLSMVSLGKLNQDSQTSILKDPGLGRILLKYKFSGQFSISLLYDELVGEIRVVVNGVLTQDLWWRRSFLLRGISIFFEFLSLHLDVILTRERDKWIQMHSREDTLLWLLLILSRGLA